MTGFGDLHEYAWGPRVGSVALSPDGTWVALAMQTVGDTPPKYLTSIWRADAEPGDATLVLTSLDGGEPQDLLPGLTRIRGGGLVTRFQVGVLHRGPRGQAGNTCIYTHLL